MPLTTYALLAAFVSLALPAAHAEDRYSLPVKIHVDAAESHGPLKEIYRFFGADEPNYAYMKDGKKLLKHLGELHTEGPYFRTHNLMCTGPGTPALKWGSTNMYREDANGAPIYDWEIVDLIFDTYLESGVRPYVQMGFMPEAMSSKPTPYQHAWRPGIRYDRVYTGWAYPPKDYEKWGELCFQWAAHCVERYGREEVEKWYWQTWNEANIGYWQGTAEEFYKLHDYAIAGVLKALPTARVGGPDTAGWGGEFAKRFYEHNLRGTNFATGERGSRLDFVSFHAKGSPKWQGDFIRMGIANQLQEIDRGFALVGSFPELKNTPIIIGESDPEGCAACQGKDVSYRNGTMYSSYTAASFARKHDLADKHGINLEGALSWSFTFEDQAYFAGFRQMASNGLDLPVLNVMRMFSKMDGTRVAAESDHQVPLDAIVKDGVRERPDIGTLASRRDSQIAVMVWYYHDDDLPGPNAHISLDVAGFPSGVATATLTHHRVDAFHSNVYTEWQRMGSPVAPNEQQYAQLEQASALATVADPATLPVEAGHTAVTFELPRQGVSLLVFNWPE